MYYYFLKHITDYTYWLRMSDADS